MRSNLIVRSPLSQLLGFDVDFPNFKNSLNTFSTIDSLKVDIVENEKEFQVVADIPGVNKDNIKVDFDNGLLSIEVQSQTQKEEKEGEKILRMERSFSKKSRSFSFEPQINAEGITAKYENGVLSLVLPKREPDPKIQKILIQ